MIDHHDGTTNQFLCCISTCRLCDEVRRKEQEARCPTRAAQRAEKAVAITVSVSNAPSSHWHRYLALSAAAGCVSGRLYDHTPLDIIGPAVILGVCVYAALRLSRFEP